MSLCEMSEKTYSYQVYPPTKHIDPMPFFSQTNPTQDKLFSYRMLASPLRQKVITKIKDPLRKALKTGKSFPKLVLIFWTIILVSWRIKKYVGKVTKQNSVFKNVHTILDMAELIKRCHHNNGREAMVNSSLEIVAAIIEHDIYYRQIAYRMAYFIHKQIETGEWVLDLEPFPKELAHCWDDNKFMNYLGGQYGSNNNNQSE